MKIVRDNNGQFVKGNQSGNKFKKGVPSWNKDLSINLSPKSNFKKGITTMENHPSWKGGIQNPKKDCVYLTVGTNKQIRRPKQVYEEVYGKIPKGYVIYHINHDNKDDSLDNLEVVSRAELLRRNRKK